MPRLLVAIAFLIALIGVPVPVETWGPSGHRIVARVAARFLVPATRQKLRAILGVSDANLETSMANASIWPDRIDKVATGTERWHYVNAPVFSPFSLSGQCAGGLCVTSKIDDMARRLATNDTYLVLNAPPVPSRPRVQQVLAFLIHFVGDIHQPLHAVANADRGGNCVLLTSPIVSSTGTTDQLHTLWDINAVQSVMALHNNSEAQTVTALFQQATAGGTVTQGTPTDWARESHALALADIYDKLNIPMHSAAPGQCATNIQKVAIGPFYLLDNAADVETRLMKGGIRLANLLNSICGGAGCQAN